MPDFLAHNKRQAEERASKLLSRENNRQELEGKTGTRATADDINQQVAIVLWAKSLAVAAPV